MLPKDIDNPEATISQSPFSVGSGSSRPEAAPTRQQAPPDPAEAFQEAQKMSYTELAGRRAEQRRLVKEHTTLALGQMSEAMKRIHIEELILIADCDALSQGAAPAQAVVALHCALEDMDHFDFIDGIYPELRAKVKVKYEAIVRDRLVPNIEL
jgi:hypothetical protein